MELVSEIGRRLTEVSHEPRSTTFLGQRLDVLFDNNNKNNKATHWVLGRCTTWDVTVTDTVAASYLSATSACTAWLSS